MVKVFVSFFLWFECSPVAFSCERPSFLQGGRREGGREDMGEDAGGEGLASSEHQPTAAASWFLTYGSERLSGAHDKPDLMSSC